LICGDTVLMTPAALSYAQSLRVMGQALEALRIDSFELEKRGDEYVVRMDLVNPQESYRGTQIF